MKSVNWGRYSWNLTKFAPVYPAVAPSYSIRRATAEDHDLVKSVVISSFTLDSAWNPFFRDIHPQIDAALAKMFGEKSEPFCILVSHGSRIIGASCLSAERDAENHLLTGPCLSMEYHNRGLATALLAESLIALRDAGLTTARGVTRPGSIAAQFIYTKFGSTRLPEDAS